MTKKNNYNANANGTSIELSCFYDTNAAQIYFEDNFKRLQDETYSTNSILFFTNYRQNEEKELEDFYIVTNNTRDNVINMLTDVSSYWIDSEKYTKEYFAKMTNEELTNETRNETEINFYDADFFEFDEENFGCIESRGYSQGDYAEIYYDKKELEKLRGKEVNERDFSDIFHNLLWDCPISFYLKIDDIEIFGDDFLTSEYLYGDDIEEQTIQHIKEHKKLSEKQKKDTLEFLDSFDFSNISYS